MSDLAPCLYKQFPIPIQAHQRQNIEDVVLTEVPKLMADASDLALTITDYMYE